MTQEDTPALRPDTVTPTRDTTPPRLPYTAETIAVMARWSAADWQSISEHPYTAGQIARHLFDYIEASGRSGSPAGAGLLREALERHEANLLSLGRTMVEPRPENWEPILGERIAAVVNGLNIVREVRAALAAPSAGADHE